MSTDPLAIAATVSQGIQLIALIAGQVERVQRGELSPDDLRQQWADIGLRLDVANAAWEAARPPQ